MNKRIIATLTLALFSCTASRQSVYDTTVSPLHTEDESKWSIVLMQPIGIEDNQFETEQLATFVGDTLKVARKQFDTTHHQVIIEIELLPDREPNLRLAAQPKLTEAEKEHLTVELRKIPVLNTKFSSWAYRLVRGGESSQGEPFNPPFISPSARRFQRFREARPKEKVEMIKERIRRHVLPLLATAATSVEAKFKGVRGSGSILQAQLAKKDFRSEQLTASSDFWRGLLEMAPGNPLVLAMPVFLVAAQGKFDFAFSQAQIVVSFSDSKLYLTAELMDFIHYYDELTQAPGGINERIKEAIARYDENKPGESKAILDGIIADYPNSAWARHELLLIFMTQHSDDAFDVTKDHMQKQVYEADPLYPFASTMKGSEQIYKGLQRVKLQELQKDREHVRRFLVSYADIAVDLEQYAVAGQLYHLAMMTKGGDESPLFSLVLYCAQKAGAKDFLELFKPDKVKVMMEEAAARRRKRYEESATKIEEAKN